MCLHHKPAQDQFIGVNLAARAIFGRRIAIANKLLAKRQTAGADCVNSRACLSPGKITPPLEREKKSIMMSSRTSLKTIDASLYFSWPSRFSQSGGCAVLFFCSDGVAPQHIDTWDGIVSTYSRFRQKSVSTSLPQKNIQRPEPGLNLSGQRHAMACPPSPGPSSGSGCRRSSTRRRAASPPRWPCGTAPT